MLMDLDALAVKYGMVGSGSGNVSGILHLGAHLAEEAGDYERVFPKIPVWWVEANPEVVPKIEEVLESYPTQQLIQALITSRDGSLVAFHVSNDDGMTSSIFEYGTVPEFSPESAFIHDLMLESRSVDSLVAEHNIRANLLVMDLQGAEGLALAGAGSFLEGVDFVMSEVNEAEVYRGCAKVGQLDVALSGFDRTETFWVADQGWGDSLWRRSR